MFLLSTIKAYLCPNIINFDGVDVSKCRSEEALDNFLLTLSVNGFAYLLAILTV